MCSYVINPVNGEKLLIGISYSVLVSYGTGAVMAVPSGDQRDYDFSTKFDLPIKPVIEGTDVSEGALDGTDKHINSGILDGLHIADAMQKEIDWL
ncbi:hypothetical protein [Limosilactobacillus reuteri]|uniref:hypothetical protein n=1 Tax=Limosilactobacillus reuteri TaxID=1598 RepID=UPI001CDB3DC3